MPSTYRALCSDFYINTKLSVRMELPTNREPVLELFEAHPAFVPRDERLPALQRGTGS